jgi:hypothetical protein
MTMYFISGSATVEFAGLKIEADNAREALRTLRNMCIYEIEKFSKTFLNPVCQLTNFEPLPDDICDECGQIAGTCGQREAVVRT